jgi:outer membrane protein OmpA-like peptidoglycan-associated protein
MIVYDSGLSTTSLLNFATQNIIDEPIESIVSQLESYHAIPDLTGIDIIWIGLGQTCGEQENLTSSYKYKLQEIWTAILEAGGATSVTFDKTPLTAEEYSGKLPACSTVPIVVDSLELTELITDEEMPEVIKWDGNSNIQFLGNVADFADPEIAESELAPIAEYLVSHPDESVYIFGMTATVIGGDLGIELSEARAGACREKLLEAGVNENQVITIGLGQLDNPLRTADTDENGNQIQELAQKNRAVIFVKNGSQLLDTLLSCAENANEV